MTFWCGFGDGRAQARDRVAPPMAGLYRMPFENFERYVPYGTVAEVAEFVAPFVAAGARTLNVVPFAGGDDAGIDAVAELRKILEEQS